MGLILLIENLPQQANELIIRQFFSRLAVRIPDSGIRICGGPKCSAHVAFASENDLMQALMLDQQLMLGQQVKLTMYNGPGMGIPNQQIGGPGPRGFSPNSMGNRLPPPNAQGPMGNRMMLPGMGAPNQMGNRMGPPNQMGPRMAPPNQMGPRMAPSNQMGPRMRPPNMTRPRIGPPIQMGPRMGPPNQMGPRLGPPSQMGNMMSLPDIMGPRMGTANQMGPRMGPVQMGPRVGPPNQMGPRMGPGPPDQIGPRMGPANQIGPMPGPMGPRIGLPNQMGPRMGPPGLMGNRMPLPNQMPPPNHMGFSPNIIGNGMPLHGVPLKQPLRTLFQVPDHQDQFYLGISQIPSDISACELWGWMAGEMGISQGVVLISVPEDQESSIAFAVFKTEQCLLETMHKLKRKHQFVRPYSVGETNSLLANVESTSLVFVSTTKRTDKLLLAETRANIGVGNIHRNKCLLGTEKSHIDDPLGKQECGESMEETTDWGGITSVFPMPDRKDQFYLGLSNLKEGITASELKSYLCTGGSKTQGVVLARVPPSHKSLSSRAFAVFQNKTDSEKAMEIMKTKQKNISEYSSTDVSTFLNSLEDNCIIFISTEAGKDRMLVRPERCALREGSIKSTEQNLTTSNKTRISENTEIKDGICSQDDEIEGKELDPVDDKTEWERQKLMFPMLGNDQQYYIKISHLREGITACKLSTWLSESGCKAQGVLFAWIPADQRSSPSRAFALYHSEDDVQNALKVLKTVKSSEQHVSMCSSTEANAFLTDLGYNSILFMSTEKGKDVMLTHAERCKLEEEVRKISAELGHSETNSEAAADVKTEHKQKLNDITFLFPKPESKDQFYLGLSNLPPSLSACELWSWFGGIEGKSQGIVLGRVPSSHRFFSSLAFAVFKNVDDLEEAMQALKTVHEYRARYSCSDVNRFLEGLDATCQVFVTTSSGKDKLVTAIGKKEVIPKTKQSSIEISSGVDPSKISSGVAPPKTIFTPPPLRFLFPVSEGKKQFYLGLSNLPVGISACGLLSWMGGLKGPAQGVALARFPSSSNSPPTMAFAAFRSEENLLKANTTLKNSTATVVQYSSARVQDFLSSMDDSCVILVTTDSGKDKVLMYSERMKLQNKNITPLKQEMPESEAQLMVNMSPFNQQTKETVQEEDKEIPPQTWDKVISIFPSSGNREQFFIELSNLRPSITACELWKWLRGMGAKTQGVVLAKVPSDHKSLSSQAYAVFQEKEDMMQLMQSLKTKQRNMSECSSEAANAFLTGLDDSCLIFVSTESGKDRMLLSAERAALQMKPISETVTSSAQFSSLQQHSSLKRNQPGIPPGTIVFDYSDDHNDSYADDMKRRKKGESRWQQIEDPIVSPPLQASVRPPIQPMVEHNYMSLLPARVGTNVFYLALSHFPSNLTASELWSYLGGSSGTSLGIILGRVPADHPWLSSLAFAVFQTESALKEAMYKLKPTLKYVTQYSSRNAYDFLTGLADDCPIYVTTDIEMNRSLTAQERLAFRMGNIKQPSATPGQIYRPDSHGDKGRGHVKDSLLSIIATMGAKRPRATTAVGMEKMGHGQETEIGMTPGHGLERNVMAQERPIDPWVGREMAAQQSTMGVNSTRHNPMVGIEGLRQQSSSNTEHEYTSKTFMDSPFLLMFPSFSPTRKFYLGIFGVPQDVSASEIWSWVCGGVEKGEGIILGRVPARSQELSCRAFVVFSNQQSMLEVLKNSVVLQEHKAECSPSDVNNYLYRLDSSCQIFVTSMPGADTMLTLEDRASMGMKAIIPTMPAASSNVRARSPQPVPPPAPLQQQKQELQQHAGWASWNS